MEIILCFTCSCAMGPGRMPSYSVSHDHHSMRPSEILTSIRRNASQYPYVPVDRYSSGGNGLFVSCAGCRIESYAHRCGVLAGPSASCPLQYVVQAFPNNILSHSLALQGSHVLLNIRRLAVPRETTSLPTIQFTSAAQEPDLTFMTDSDQTGSSSDSYPLTPILAAAKTLPDSPQTRQLPAIIEIS